MLGGCCGAICRSVAAGGCCIRPAVGARRASACCRCRGSRCKGRVVHQLKVLKQVLEAGGTGVIWRWLLLLRLDLLWRRRRRRTTDTVLPSRRRMLQHSLHGTALLGRRELPWRGLHAARAHLCAQLRRLVRPCLPALLLQRLRIAARLNSGLLRGLHVVTLRVRLRLGLPRRRQRGAP